MVGRVWIEFSLLLHGCGRELLFAGVVMPLFLLRMIRRSNLPTYSLLFWVISVISYAFLLFSAYCMFYVSILSILLTFVKERKILRSRYMRHIYHNIGKSLSASPAYDTRQLAIGYLYL